MNQQNEAQQGQMEQQPEPSAKKALSRRNFLTKVGVGTLPVVLSVQSGSAWGCIKLDCSPGAINLSGTSSAVASAKQSSVNGSYVLPKWPKRSEIMRICAVDFDRYLISHNMPLLFNGNKIVRGNVRAKSIFGICGDLGDAYLFKHEYKDSEPYYKNTSGLLKQGTLEGYFVAAFMGALWERHTAYTNAFPPQPNSRYCYPEPSLLIAAYKKACLNGTKAEMLHIFKAYCGDATITG